MNTVKLSQSHRRLVTLPGRQRGVVLIVSLILLMVLTLIGVTAMQTSSLEERMTGNALDKNIAFQAAEAALRVGENRLGSDEDGLKSGEYGGWLGELDFNRDELPPEPWERDLSEWAKLEGALAEGFEEGETVSKPPHFAVELLDPAATGGPELEVGVTVSEGKVYRVTAMGYGPTEGSQVILQSYYFKE